MKGSASKKGDPNVYSRHRPVWYRHAKWAPPLSPEVSPVTREQLVPLIKAAITHRGFAFIDVVSPCVTFNNNNEGSTKSYEFVREHAQASGTVDFVPMSKEITTDYKPGYSSRGHHA